MSGQPTTITTTVVGFGKGGTNVVLGNATTDTIGFYGTAGVAQRTSTAQTAVTATVTAAGYGFITSAEANAVLAQLQEIAATLTALGIWKGS